jgi:tartrate dehydratase beta subunit/fumarate hydratase class I family protein
VSNVYFREEFGSPEAIWELQIVNFPAVVTMDSHGRSLHAEVLQASQEALARHL